ncbi:hypothetical protein KUTeg_017698 [Tegillarca granosa]|uniref:Focadhesin n=1 Tax=Tegillarca granosa TaxID=220873 RepID=A0ABQ9EFZ7_TEGGR|nr:hypothetical protein KUTeg_017698 [Tegillarca granosa]
MADRLSQETRPVVVEKICDLFSLVPALEVQTPEYESFAADILRRLWLFTQVENGTVSSAAFQALSLFKADEFKLSHFPQQQRSELFIVFILNQIVTDFIKQAQTIAEQQEQPDLTLDQIIDFVPGICCIRLMRQLETGVLKGACSTLRVAQVFINATSLDIIYRYIFILTGACSTLRVAQVPVQPSEWHRCLLMPQAWTSFIDRVRDQLVNTIKITSRGNPAMQSNSVYALAGLAVTVNRFVAGQEEETMEAAEDSTEYLSHSHWLIRTVEDRLPVSVLGQAAASLALSQLVPILITKDVDRIYDILTKLVDLLPGQPGAQESPVLNFHYGLGVGMFLARLFEEHFSDVTGNKGIMFLWKILDKFEDCCLSAAEYRSGALLGLGVTISALSEEGKTESRAHVSALYDKLMSLWEKTDVTHDAYQALSVCVSCVAGSSFSSNILQVPQVKTVMDKMLQLNKDQPESSPPMQKVACLNGLFALAGSERTLIPIQASASLSGGDINTDNLIKMASQIVAIGDDLGIQSNSAWMLGHLYLSACAVAETRASVPPSYTYLPESSVLRAVVDFLLEAGKSGVDVKELCLQIAVQQSGSAPTAAMFLSSWLQPSLFNTLNVLFYAASIVAVATCMWLSETSAAVLGLDPDLLKNSGSNLSTVSQSFVVEPVYSLPIVLKALHQEPWEQILGKFVDWLTTMTADLDKVEETLQQKLCLSLMMLRHSSEFRKPQIWTKVVSVIF